MSRTSDSFCLSCGHRWPRHYAEGCQEEIHDQDRGTFVLCLCPKRPDRGPIPGEDFDPQQEYDDRMQRAEEDEQRYSGSEGR